MYSERTSVWEIIITGSEPMAAILIPPRAHLFYICSSDKGEAVSTWGEHIHILPATFGGAYSECCTLGQSPTCPTRLIRGLKSLLGAVHQLWHLISTLLCTWKARVQPDPCPNTGCIVWSRPPLCPFGNIPVWSLSGSMMVLLHNPVLHRHTFLWKGKEWQGQVLDWTGWAGKKSTSISLQNLMLCFIIVFHLFSLAIRRKSHLAS